MRSTHAGELVRRARVSRRLSQAGLAIRAGTSQSAVSLIERGVVSPSVESLERLLLVTGHQLRAELVELEHEWDESQIAGAMRKKLNDRMAEAIAWNRLAHQVTEAGRRARKT